MLLFIRWIEFYGECSSKVVPLEFLAGKTVIIRSPFLGYFEDFVAKHVDLDC